MVTVTALPWTLVTNQRSLRAHVAALLFFCCLPLLAAPDQYAGKTITRVDYEPAAQPFPAATLEKLVALRPGEKLGVDAVRAAIQRLYVTGRYTDISVDATAEGEGVALKFITVASEFVGGVSVDGVPEPPSKGQLSTTTKLQLGAEFSPQDLKQAQENLDDVLRRNGFYQPRIAADTNLDQKTQQINFDFRVSPGKRAKFDGLTVIGHPERTPESLLRSAGLKRLRGLLGWNSVTENRVQSSLEGMRSWYQKHDHLLAHVTLTKLDYHPETNRVTETVEIESGPIVKVKLLGAKLSGGRQRQLLPIYEERTVDKDLLVEGRRNLIEYFQGQGYFEADANFETIQEPNGQEEIDYTVERGGRHKLVFLEIQGNHYFDRPTLRERMFLTPATFIRFRHGRYSQQFVERDTSAIRDLYRSNGFRDVEVTSREEDDYQGKPEQIAVFIDIKEGPQSFVDKLSIQGVGADDEAFLRSVLHSTEGQPYSELNISSDRDSILNYFFNNGYQNAAFDFNSTPADGPNRVDLNFIVTPGERQFVRSVVLNGLQQTRTKLVTDRISLADGDPLSQLQITESQRRLYDLGIFAKVNAAVQNPDGEEENKYVLYQIEEARRYSVNVGFGAEIARIGGSNASTNFDSPAGTTGFSPRVTLGVTRLNFLGVGHTVGLQTRLSTLQRRALLSYLAPQFQGSPNLNLTFTALYDDSKDVRTFSARRLEGAIQLGQKLSRANSIQYRFQYRDVNIIGTPKITPELIPILSQPVRVGIVSTTFIQDRRDDPSDAHRGIYNTIDAGYAAGALGSNTSFGKVVARNATYYRIRRDVVLARSTYFGLLQRTGGLADIPLPERFFSGGSSSHRGFPDNQAGPRDLETGFPLGGKALVINTVEVRFPLIGDNIGGVIFHDMGNVYTSLRTLSFRYSQKGLNDFDYAVQTLGFGIRYRTPVGPVRVDLAYSPNAPRFNGFQGSREDLLFGRGKFVEQKINSFQFHFTLGQAF